MRVVHTTIVTVRTTRLISKRAELPKINDRTQNEITTDGRTASKTQLTLCGQFAPERPAPAGGPSGEGLLVAR
jgi:hypothetical protein